MSLLRKHSTRKSSIFKKSQSKSQDVEYSALDLSSLRRQRTIAYKRMCKALEVGVLAINDEAQRDMFFSYHQDIKKIASNFEDAHFTILDILDDPDTDDSGIQERFDEMYYKVISIYRSLNKDEACTSRLPSSSLSNVRLPKIQLPTFAGDIKHFPEYFDTFNALIHNSTSLSGTEKFHYLISSLSGDAITIVKTFPLSSEYYRDAHAALTARYKCKRELAFTCWREILTMNFNFKDAHEFRKSLDLFEENLCILKSVNLPVTHWDFVLVYHILSKLDTSMRRDFEEKHSNTELPSYTQLKQFLHSKCEALLRDTHFTEQAHLSKLAQKVNSPPAQPKRVPTSSYTLIAAEQSQSEVSGLVTARPITCSYCNESHSISSCPEFLEKSIDDRMKVATDRNWCFNCLKSSHQLRNCTSVFSCRTCKRKHHSLLHRHASNEPSESVSALVSRSQLNTTVLLATAIVQVKDALGIMQPCQALFDTGSQSSLITESTVRRLKLNRSQSITCVSGLGEKVASILGDVTCCIGLNNKTFVTLDLHVMSQICGDQPIAKLNTTGWSHIESLPLADPNFDTPGPIDILFAADIFAESLLNQQIKGSSNQPTAFSSVFGWLLLGKTSLVPGTSLENTDITIKSNLLVQSFKESPSKHEHIHNVTGYNIAVKDLIPIDLKTQPNDNEPHLCFRDQDIVSRVLIYPYLACPSVKIWVDYGYESCTHIVQTTFDVPIKNCRTERDKSKNAQEVVYFWSGLIATLPWTRYPSNQWANFVASRFINPSEFWHHVACHVTSGVYPIDTLSSQRTCPSETSQNWLWWAGHRWLSRDYDICISTHGTIPPEEEVIVKAEARQAVILTTERMSIDETSTIIASDDLLYRYSSLQNPTSVLSVLPYVNHFINNIRNPLETKRNTSFRHVLNRQDTLMHRVVNYQPRNASHNKPFPQKFRKLNPLLDSEDLFMVGGRMSRPN